MLVGFHERASSFVADMTSCEVLPAPVSALLVPLRRLVESLSMRDRLPQIELAVADRAGWPADRARAARAARRRRRTTGRGWQSLPAAMAWSSGCSRADHRPRCRSIAQQPSALQLSLPEFGVSVAIRPDRLHPGESRHQRGTGSRAHFACSTSSHERVIDFFCGLGNFTLPLATRAAHVWATRAATPLVERARASPRRPTRSRPGSLLPSAICSNGASRRLGRDRPTRRRDRTRC